MFNTDKPSDFLTSHDICDMSWVCSQGLIIFEIAISSQLMFYPAGGECISSSNNCYNTIGKTCLNTKYRGLLEKGGVV